MSIQLTKINQSLMFGEKPNIQVPVNGWIAGGAIRRWFTGKETLSDIDAFFMNEKALDDYIVFLKNLAAKELESHKNAITFDLNGVRVQCIRVKWYETVEVLLDSFDFTVCQFAWDGRDVYTNSESIISVLRNHLGAHNISKEFAVDSLRRAFKYAKKGYYPCNGTMQKIAHSLRVLTEEEVNNAIEISPNGGRRTVGID